jgi:hypothetical protein
MAYRINPDFASTLASGLDDDPVRKARQEEIKMRLDTLKLRDSLQEGDEKVVTKKGENPRMLSEAAWMALRNLNSGKVNAMHSENTRGYIERASVLKLHDAYWMVSLVVENAVRRYKNTNEASTYLKPLFKACVVAAHLTFQAASKMRNSVNAHRLSILGNDRHDGSLIRSGERQKALEMIRRWVRNEARDSIRICDPYFGPDDLALVQLIRSENPTIPISVLTSRRHQQDEQVQVPWEDSYQTHWRIHISEADPGDVRIVVLGTRESGVMPIHDRWLVSTASGLRLGSSLNSIGIAKASEVTEIESRDLPDILALVDKHINGVIRGQDGERLLYSSFYLA